MDLLTTPDQQLTHTSHRAAHRSQVTAKSTLDWKHPCGKNASRRRSPRPLLRDLFARQDIWLPPVLLEAVIAAAAGMLATFFYLVITTQPYGLALLPLGTAILIGAALKFWVRANELFMTRPIVVLLVGPMALGCASLAAVILAFGSELESPLSLPARAIVVLPLCLFVVRAMWCIRNARFAPRLDTVQMRMKPNGGQLANKLQDTLRFWFE